MCFVNIEVFEDFFENMTLYLLDYVLLENLEKFDNLLIWFVPEKIYLNVFVENCISLDVINLCCRKIDK